MEVREGLSTLEANRGRAEQDKTAKVDLDMLKKLE